jgi:hypothetical protein
LQTVPKPQWTSFEAKAVAFVVDDRLNTRYLMMAEKKWRAGHRLEIQRALIDDEQDRELGQDTHCLVDELSCVHYGGVTRWQLDDDVLQLELSAKAGEVMGAGAGHRIAVPKSHHQTVIRDALASLLT